MLIKIGQRLRPFSHIPGTFCLLPGTTTRMQVFPTRIVYDDMAAPFPRRIKEIDFQRKGPIKDFSVQQDLEKGKVIVWGHAQEGYFHYQEEGKSYSAVERLSLGSHKAQDMDLIHRRRDFKEIFPLWFQLGQSIPETATGTFEGSLSLLEECEKAIASGHPETIIPQFEKVYLAGFEGLLSPRLNDDQFQGLGIVPATQGSASPLWLLSKGYELIRSLFVRFTQGNLQILPALPPEFHCGRLVGIRLPGIGTLDLEWTKKTVRRCVIHCEQAGELVLVSKGHKTVRVNRGEMISLGLLELTPGSWAFDHFK